MIISIVGGYCIYMSCYMLICCESCMSEQLHSVPLLSLNTTCVTVPAITPIGCLADKWTLEQGIQHCNITQLM